jgi:hypothetical protein
LVVESSIEEHDMPRAARLVIRRRDDPEMYAAARADAMLADGDLAGEATWKQILVAIKASQRTSRLEGEGVN